MSGTGVVILLVFGVPLLAFVVWQFLQEARVRIDSGSVGLLIARGKATDHVLAPGVHYIWPYRQQMIQGYPLRELTYLTADDAVEDTDFADSPLKARLGDRARVLVLYTVRFRIRPDALREIHETVGPDGIKRLVRDRSRQVIIDELAAESHTIDDAFGTARERLESTIAEQITQTFHNDGFEVTMFSLRDVDLCAVNEVIDATVRSKAELELERAAALVRKLRVENEAKSSPQLATALSDAVLRYRQLELGREALQRWDGRIVIGDGAPRATLALGRSAGTQAETEAGTKPAARSGTKAGKAAAAATTPDASPQPATDGVDEPGGSQTAVDTQ